MVSLNDCWVFDKQNAGLARNLRGKVLVELVFAQDETTKWFPHEMDRFFGVYKQAEEEICKQAKAAGVPLSFIAVREHLVYIKTGSEDYGSQTVAQIYRQYIQKKGYTDPVQYGEHRKRTYGADEICLLIIQEKNARAFAHSAGGLEYCALYDNDEACVIVHELLHLFGAADLYFPYHVLGLTMKQYPRSAMCTYEGMEIDPLTQYLIGWREVAPFRVREFLCKIADCTRDRHDYATALEWYRSMDEEAVLKEARPYPSMDALRSKSASGDPWAEFLMGLCYREGIGVEKSMTLAETHFSRSGRGGLLIGAYAHAQMLLYRGFHSQDDAETLDLLLNYHAWDHLQFNSLRIACYYAGVGVPKKQEWAIEQALSQQNFSSWYQERGKQAAKLYRFAKKLSENLPDLRNVVSGMLDRYQKILRDGDPDLQFFVARLMEKGEGTPQDQIGAFKLYSSSARNGNYRACYALSRCYRDKIGTDRDELSAEQWRIRGEVCRRKNRWDIVSRLL